uniref:Uncharacterized protein n=1 Tax=Panagrolaimus sp. ES5 TaxID=591445 RepID=A0AC34FV29_9BILA
MSKKRSALLNEANGILKIPCNHICETILYENFQKEQNRIKQKYENVPSSSKKNYERLQNVNSKSAFEISSSTSTPTTSSTLNASSSKPVYFGARLPSSIIRNSTFHSKVIYPGVKRSFVGKPRKNITTSLPCSNFTTPVPAKKTKPTEIEPESRDSDEESNENVRTKGGQSQSVTSMNLKLGTLQNDKNEEQSQEACLETYKFWLLNIKVSNVSPEAIPDKLHTTIEKNYYGFECISLYITGDESKAEYIREKINFHLYNENSGQFFHTFV